MYLLAHSSFCSRRMAPTSRVMAASLGKIPTTLVRRLTSAWSRSIGFVECNFWRCSLGKLMYARTSCSASSKNCQLGHLGPELVGDLAPLDLRAVGVLLGEGGGDEGGDDAPALAAGMGQQVAGEVHAAALPCGAEDPGRGGLQALVVVGDHQLHAAQPAPGQRAQELGPEGLGLRRADRHAQDLAAALVVDGHSHGHRDRDDASGLAHLHVGGVEPQIGPVALQRSIGSR